jgi:hypothetical protein
VVRIPDYRSRGPGFDSRQYQIFLVVGLEQDPLSLVSTSEGLLGRSSNGSGQGNRDLFDSVKLRLCFKRKIWKSILSNSWQAFWVGHLCNPCTTDNLNEKPQQMFSVPTETLQAILRTLIENLTGKKTQRACFTMTVFPVCTVILNVKN